jgi:hypothetical protein
MLALINLSYFFIFFLVFVIILLFNIGLVRNQTL